MGVVLATAVVGAAVLVVLVRHLRSSESCPPPRQPYAAIVRSDGAIGYWRLDEKSGRNAKSSVASTPTGRYVGLRPEQRDDAGVLAADGAIDLGVDAYVVIPPSARYRRLPHWSVEAWIRPTEPTPKRADVALLAHAWRKSSLPFVLAYGSYDARYRDARHAWTGFYDQPRRRWSRVADPVALPINAWTHLVGTYDGASIRLYKNGVEVDSVPATGVPVAGPTPLYIGARWWRDSWQFFSGRVDEVALYPTALRAATIERHYAAARPSGRALAPC